MPERAKVTSLEALESFRARLIVYREKANRVLDEVSDQVTRTRLWLETDRPAFWQNHIRRLSRELEQAQQELFSARLSDLRDASINQQAAVQKLRRSLRDAEDKTKTVKQWQRQYDTRVEMPARQAEKLRHFLEHDLSKAISFLNEAIKNIAAYAELSLSGSAQSHSELPTSVPSQEGNKPASAPDTAPLPGEAGGGSAAEPKNIIPGRTTS